MCFLLDMVSQVNGVFNENISGPLYYIQLVLHVIIIMVLEDLK
jgi:hypothetical protein